MRPLRLRDSPVKHPCDRLQVPSQRVKIAGYETLVAIKCRGGMPDPAELERLRQAGARVGEFRV